MKEAPDHKLETATILAAVQTIESEHVEQLNTEVRYERYITDESNEDWVHILGPDVSFATHPHETLSLVNNWIKIDQSLSTAERDVLRTAALTHDWGELIIEGNGIGDITYNDKTTEHEDIERDIFKKVIQKTNTAVQKHLLETYIDVVHDRESKLGNIFNAVERIGYLLTGMRAYTGHDGQKIANWKGLTGNVFSNQIKHLVPLAQTYSPVAYMLQQNRELITRILNQDWITVPLDNVGKPAYEPTALQEAQQMWEQYVSEAL